MTNTSITTISIKRLMFKETSERNLFNLKVDTASRIARSRHHSNLELFLSWLT
jgi:hypothetical protein